MDDTLSLIEQKKDILDNFDFDQVEMIMRMPCIKELDSEDLYHPWKMIYDGKLVQYNKALLKDLADRLLSEVIEHCGQSETNLFYIGTGPFKAEYRYGILELSFVVTSWSCD